jgi:aminopeptidase C
MKKTYQEDLKERIIKAGYKAVEELIKIAEEPVIIKDADNKESADLAADRLKNAAASKRLAIFDALEILSKIESEQNKIEDTKKSIDKKDVGFAEARAK